MQVRSYGAGFIFTTSLPPTVLAGAIASIRLLRFCLDIPHGCPHPHLVSGVKRDVPFVLFIRRMWPTFERNFATLGYRQHHHTFQADSHNLLIIKTVSDLLDLQVSVQHTPSHIIPVHVGDPILSSTLSDNLLRNHGHYVQVGRVDHMLGDGDNILGDGDHSFPKQAINYPTVARGEEKLRVAPTPHHTKLVFQHSVDGTQKGSKTKKR